MLTKSNTDYNPTNRDDLPPRLLTVKDIMTIFGIGKNKAYTLMRTKGFPLIYVGRDMRVDPKALREWIDQHKGRQTIR